MTALHCSFRNYTYALLDLRKVCVCVCVPLFMRHLVVQLPLCRNEFVKTQVLLLLLSSVISMMMRLLDVSVCFCTTPEPLLVVQSTSLLLYFYLHCPSISSVVFLGFFSHWYSFCWQPFASHSWYVPEPVSSSTNILDRTAVLELRRFHTASLLSHWKCWLTSIVCWIHSPLLTSDWFFSLGPSHTSHLLT